MAFQFEAPPSRLTASIADMIARGGSSQAQAIRQIAEAQAQAAQIRGRALGGAIENVGQVVGSIPAQMQQQKIQDQNNQIRAAQLAGAQRETADRTAMDTALGSGLDPDQIEAALPGHLKMGFRKSWNDAESAATNLQTAKTKAEEAEADYFGALAKGVEAHLNEPDGGLGAMQVALQHAKSKGFKDADQVGAQIQTPAQLRTLVTDLIQRSPTQRKLSGEEADRALKTKQEERAIQSAATAASDKQADNDRADKAQVALERHQRAMEAATRLRAATTGGNPDDVKDAVQGMIDGDIPPQLPGRASKDYLAVMGEAKRRGYDLASAATDWVATQKHISAMNSNQQLRLNQSINQLPELLDSVDALAAKWKGGRFPLLNKANLAAAKNGIYGDEVASIARQLDTQIADVTADLGNVYMGGNSPTDHALKLAGTALSGDWSEKVLTDMTKLARQNVKTRLNSIKNTGVQGASEDNPYAPPQVNSTWIRDANGKLVKQ